MINRLRRELVVVVALAALALFAALAVQYGRTSFAPGSQNLYGHDFQSFYAAARLADAGTPAAAYDRARHHAMQRAVVAETTGGGDSSYYFFGYPPTYLMLIEPLGLVDYGMAFAVFMAAGAVLLAGVLGLIGGWRAVVVGFAAPVTALTFIYGQNAWATAGLAGLAMVLLPGRPVLAGVALGLLTVKPQLGLAYPFALLAAGYYRTVTAAVLTTAALVALSFADLGWPVWEAFLDGAAVSRSVLMENSEVGIGRIQSVFALVRFLGGAPLTAYLAQGSVAGVVAVVLVRAWRGPAAHSDKAALTLASTLAMSPFVLPYDLTALVPAAALLVAGRTPSPAVQAALFAAAILAIPAIMLFADQGVLFGLPALALVYGAALMATRAAPPQADVQARAAAA